MPLKGNITFNAKTYSRFHAESIDYSTHSDTPLQLMFVQNFYQELFLTIEDKKLERYMSRWTHRESHGNAQFTVGNWTTYRLLHGFANPHASSHVANSSIHSNSCEGRVV